MTEEYLGIVQVAPNLREVGSIEYSRLRPTHVARNGAWHSIDATAFPDKGMVFWYKPGRSVKHGSVWSFGVAAQPNYDPTQGRYDQLQVAGIPQSRASFEAVTLPGITDLRGFHHTLASMSVKLPVRPVGRVLLRVPGPAPQWIGPIDPPVGTNTADPSQLLVVSSDGFLRQQTIPDDAFQDIVIEGRVHRLVRPGLELPTQAGYFSLQNDADLLRSLLKRVRKWNPELASVAEPAQELIRAYEAGIGSELLSEEERLRERARLRAARALLDELETRLHLDSELMQFVVLELLELPSVRGQLDAKQRQTFEGEREALRAEVQLELDAARQALTEAQAATRRTTQEQQALVERTEETVRGIVAQAVPKLTEHAVFRALHGPVASEPPARAPTPAPTPTRTREPARLLSSRAEISSVNFSAAAAHHVDPYVLNLVVSLLAGAGMVLLGGASADRAARAAGGVLASGSVVRVSVTPATFGTAELMSAACSPVGENDSPAATLGEFLQRASQENEMSVVVLQGCNRAPPENSLLDLIELLAPPSEARRLAWIDRRGEVQETFLDGRTVFIGTLASGDTTFALPAALAYRVPTVWTERHVTERLLLENAAPWTPTRATLDVCKIAGEPVSMMDEAAVQSLKETFADAEPVTILATYLRRVRAAFGKDVNRGVGEALAALVAGRASRDRQDRFAKALPVEIRGAFDAAIEASNESLRRYYAKEQP